MGIFTHKLKESLFYCPYLEAGCLLKIFCFPGQDPSTLHAHMIFWVTPPLDLQTLVWYFSLKNYLLCLTEVSTWQVAIFYGSTKKKPLLLKNKFFKRWRPATAWKYNLQLHLKGLKIQLVIFCTIKENQMMNALYVLSEEEKKNHIHFKHSFFKKQLTPSGLFLPAFLFTPREKWEPCKCILVNGGQMMNIYLFHAEFYFPPVFFYT